LASNWTLPEDRYAVIITLRTGTNVIEPDARRTSTAARRSPRMDALIALFAIVAALAVLDVLSIVFGADSRDGFGDDCLRTTLG
jgi:hypothetical protein